LETDFPDGQCGMEEEFTEKLIEKLREYVFLYDTCHPAYKNLVKKVEAWKDIYASTTVTFFFYNSVLTEQEFRPHRNGTS
jgi:hypothetical protein